MRSPQHGFSIGRKNQRITGAYLREATAGVEPTTGTTVQVYLLAHSVPAVAWNAIQPGDRASRI